jgi:hypothetical protein
LSKSRKVTVSITWDHATNSAYRVSFSNIGSHWNKCELVITLIKQTIPSSQRDYDSEIKTWFIGESFIKGIVDTCFAIPDFDVIFTEKPSEVQAFKMHNKDEDYAEFLRMLSFAHITYEDGGTPDFKTAKKAYLRAAFYLHPDKNPNMATEMSTLNEVWSRLQHSMFKEKEIPCPTS